VVRFRVAKPRVVTADTGDRGVDVVGCASMMGACCEAAVRQYAHGTRTERDGTRVHRWRRESIPSNGTSVNRGTLCWQKARDVATMTLFSEMITNDAAVCAPTSAFFENLDGESAMT